MDVTPDSLAIVRRGRRPRAEAPATASFRMRLSPAERQELERVAADEGRALTAVVRDAVNEYVADYSERRVFRR